MEVTPQAAAHTYKQAVKSINKGVSLPGFRKGKAPEKLIAEHYPKQLSQEWADLVVHLAYKESIDLSGLHPLNAKSVKKPILNECSQEKGAQVQIEFERAPEIPDVDISLINIAEKPARDESSIRSRVQIQARDLYAKPDSYISKQILIPR